jgi:Baseplate J-like protein
MTEAAVPEPESQILYLEPEDEIPSVVRRLREADAQRIVLVAPGRSKATSSAIGLRLLARHATHAGRTMALVADPASRALAAEAGIAAFASIGEAQAGEVAASSREDVPSRTRGSIHVVRGEDDSLSRPLSLAITAAPDAAQRTATPAPSMTGIRRLDETQAVPVVAPRVAAPRTRSLVHRKRSRVQPRAAAAAAAVAVLMFAALVAAVLPAATVHLVRAASRVGPVSYAVTLPAGRETGSLESTQSGTATGKYDSSTPARGTVTFANYSSQKVQVPKGTPVSAGDLVFTTDAAVTVPKARGFDVGSTANVAITAQAPGPDSNVDTHAIDTIDDEQVRSDLCAQFLFCTRRLVANNEPLTGGMTKTGKLITQQDVDAAVAKIRTDLDQQLQARLTAGGTNRVYAPPEQAQDAVITIPKNLVGTKDKDSFELQGTLDFDRRYVTTDQVTQAGDQRLRNDQAALGSGRELLDGTVAAEPTNLRATGDQVATTLEVTGLATRRVDADALKGMVLGKSISDAIRSLSPYGRAHIEAWPGWVDAVPRLGFRVDLRLEAPATSAPSLTPPATASGSP